MDGETIQQGARDHAPHVWIIFFTILALAVAYLVKDLSRPSAGVASMLEPVFSLPGGYYERDIQLEISAARQGDVIFTVDGSVPTHTVGTVYAQPIHLNAATQAVTVVRARVVLPDDRLGPVISASYFVGVPATLPMISLIVEPGDFWDPERGIYANPRQEGEAWERPVDVTYVDRDRRSGFHIQAGVRIHGRLSRSFDKKALRLYFRQEYGASRLDYPLFAASEVQSFKRLVLHSGGQDWPTPPRWNWTLIRNQLAASLALELNGYATHSQPALLFINGEPWGIYQIRERLDSHFLADHYGVESADFLEAPEYVGERAILMGDSEHWDHLMQFIETHDLADADNYAYVQSQVDIPNFIDYNILQIYTANADWPRQNVRQFRPRVQGGRWHWMFWDSDHAFGAFPWYASVNLLQRVLDDAPPETGGRDALLLHKLLENPVFLDRFLSRSADLLNTTLAPASVSVHIDALSAEIEPDIAYETMRWLNLVNGESSGQGLRDWESNIQELYDFARSRPDLLRQHLVERFNLDGVVQLTFNPPASGSGYVAINGALERDLPWQGVYFRGMPVQVVAAPAPGYRFVGWDPPDLPQTSTVTPMVTSAQTITPRFEPISSDAPQPGDVIFQIGQDDFATRDRFELRVMRPGGVDLRGWRVTDNDTKTATDEGSLIFTGDSTFARVPRGTTISIILPAVIGDAHLRDDLSTWDRQMVLYAGNGHLDVDVDPGFNLGPHDNLVLLAPGPTKAFADDQGIAFVTAGRSITPASFGVLADGVLSTQIPGVAPSPRSLFDQQTHDQLFLCLFVLAGLALYLNARAKRVH